MINLTREQAEFVLAVLKAKIRLNESLPNYQVIDSCDHQYRVVASEIERQLIGFRPSSDPEWEKGECWPK